MPSSRTRPGPHVMETQLWLADPRSAVRTGQGGGAPEQRTLWSPSFLTPSTLTDVEGRPCVLIRFPPCSRRGRGMPPPPLWRQHPCPHGYVPEQTETMAVKSTAARGAAGTSSSQFVRDSVSALKRLGSHARTLSVPGEAGPLVTVSGQPEATSPTTWKNSLSSAARWNSVRRVPWV